MNYTNISENINIYFKEIRKFQNLTREDEIIFFNRIKEGDSNAVTEVFNRMSKLAVAVAKTYTGDPDLLPDLIQEANCGILEAIKKFDLSMNFRFSSYARWWMKAYISRYMNERMLVHPSNASLVMLVKKVKSRFFRENQREMSEYELLDALEEMGEVVTDLSAIVSVKIDSLSDVIGDDDHTLEEEKEFNDRTASFNNHLVDEESESLSDDVERLLRRLTDREKTLVKLKFGFITGQELTDEAVANEYNRGKSKTICDSDGIVKKNPEYLTGERCRQIVNAAIKKMKMK